MKTHLLRQIATTLRQMRLMIKLTPNKLVGENRYALYAWCLAAALLLGILLPKVAVVKGILGQLPINLVPLYWCALAAVIIFLLPQSYIAERLYIKGQVYGFALSAAIMFLALRFGVGFLLQNIAASPYDISLRGMLNNALDICTITAAGELTRAYALGAAYRSRVFLPLWIPLITVLFCLLEINFFKFTALNTTEEWFIFISLDILPTLMQGCFLTVLAICGGALPGIIYVVTINLFTRSFPFLPSLPWIADSALGITFPVLAAFALWNWHKVQTYKQTVRRQESIGLFSVALVLTVGFAWFVAGVFPVYPSVILTGSMEPEIRPGDVVLISKFTEESQIHSLAENDIINFKRENITITHRIVAVCYDSSGNIYFETKGDNNKTADGVAVLPADLNGIVNRVVPKAGLPVLWLQKNTPIPEGVLNY